MDWIHNNKPDETGTYLVSIKRRREYGNQAFLYVAYFDLEKSKWYDYDPFDDDYEPKREIRGEVRAWANDVGIYLD